MVPEFDEHGNLPPGEHPASIDEIVNRFNVHSWRTRGPLTKALQEYHQRLRNHPIIRMYVDGSYVTARLAPSDVDLTLVFSDDFDLEGEAWRFKNQAWKQRKLDIHLYRQKDIGLNRHLQNWQIDLDRNVPKGIIVLEVGR